VGASYSGLYEEGEVEHINVPPVPSLVRFLLFLPWDRVLISGSDPQRGKQNETDLSSLIKRPKWLKRLRSL